MKKYTVEEIMGWIKEHICISFDPVTSYSVHVNDDGELTEWANDAWRTIRVDLPLCVSEKYDDGESPDPFYQDFEDEGNPDFVDLAKEITREVNRAIEDIEDLENIDE